MSWRDFFKPPKNDPYLEYCKQEREIRLQKQLEAQNSEKQPVESIEKVDVQTPKKEITHFQKENEHGKIGEKEFFSSFRVPIKEEKNCIIFVVENSIKTKAYGKEILGLINKIVDSNKQYFFLMLRTGYSKSFSDTLNYDSLLKNNIFQNLFIDENPAEVNYLEIFEYIDEFYKSTNFDFEYNNKKYDIQNINVIFIGTGNSDLSKESYNKALKLLNELKGKRRIKTIKYFCMEDNQTINVAKFGFPVIGHIVTDFYK